MGTPQIGWIEELLMVILFNQTVTLVSSQIFLIHSLVLVNHKKGIYFLICSIFDPTDEFSSQGSEKDFNGSLIISECASTTQASNNPSVGTCRALYQYAANLYDELNLNPGKVCKQKIRMSKDVCKIFIFRH